MNQFSSEESKHVAKQLMKVLIANENGKLSLLHKPAYLNEVYSFIRAECHNYSIILAIDQLNLLKEMFITDVDRKSQQYLLLVKAIEVLQSKEVETIMYECSSNIPPGKTRKSRKRKSRKSRSRK